ncbi:MAG: tellurium resistance protein TehB [Desulfotalea sp.]|nr:MAG: tellurium resistance protein TehB [Desulfotalea sp.]
MTTQDLEKWNSKYLKDSGNQSASQLLHDYIDQAPSGKALDIACGNGRNSIFLHKRGFAVDAIDISTVATKRLEALNLGINVQCIDMDGWTVPENSYELIINIRFLDRRLFPFIERGIKPGGLLIFESFTGTKNKDFCLSPNELLHAFPMLKVLHFAEKPLESSARFEKSASLVAMKC